MSLIDEARQCHHRQRLRSQPREDAGTPGRDRHLCGPPAHRHRADAGPGLPARLLGTKEIMIINHTDCGMLRFTKEQIQKARSHPWISPDVPVRGFVYDVGTGRLSEVFADTDAVTS